MHSWSRIARGLFAVMCALSFTVGAQEYPSQAIKLVVPFPPGAPTDVLARIIGIRLGEKLHQPVIIDNKPGAGTTLANAAVAQAAPDGYTLLFAPTLFVISQSMYSNLPYDLYKSFTPVSLLAVSPIVLVVHPSLNASSVAELVELAKSKTHNLLYASAGSGSVTHMAGELFKLRTGIDLTHVPYRGGATAVAELISGQTQLMFATPVEVMPQVQAGRLKVLATTTLKRLPAHPDIPTVEEAGYPGFEAFAWFGVLAPARTPRAIVDRLATELALVVESPDIREKLARHSAEVMLRPAEEYGSFIAAQKAKWDAVVKASGAKVD